jgi:hypothetical protein
MHLPTFVPYVGYVNSIYMGLYNYDPKVYCSAISCFMRHEVRRLLLSKSEMQRDCEFNETNLKSLSIEPSNE